jgi:predicted nucleic acid-binding protein
VAVDAPRARIFLDANILFSAAKSDGAIWRLLQLLINAGHELVADDYVFEEARRNLEIKGPEGLSALKKLTASVHMVSATSGDAMPGHPLPLPEKDRPVLASAIHHECSALVTGDRTHFGALYGRTLHGVTIHSPRSLAAALL